MRHRKFSQRLSRPIGPRRAMLRNLVISLLRYQQIRTTKAKAKQAQSMVERLISLARQGSLQSRRLALSILDNRVAVGELFSRIAPLFKKRNSGFSRITGLSIRAGDGAQLVLLELTEKLPKAKRPPKAKKEKADQVRQPSEKAQKAKPEIKPEEKVKPPKQRPRAPKELKPKKFLGGLRKLFKKERDAL